MSKQDRQGVRTASDLERKYDFSMISGDGVKGFNSTKEQVAQLTQSFSQYVADTNGRIESLEGDATVWIYSGVPSLLNMPSVNWTTDEIKDTHIDDVYINKDDGSMYLFGKTEQVYGWTLVNTSQDTPVEISNGSEYVIGYYNGKPIMRRWYMADSINSTESFTIDSSVTSANMVFGLGGAIKRSDMWYPIGHDYTDAEGGRQTSFLRVSTNGVSVAVRGVTVTAYNVYVDYIL